MDVSFPSWMLLLPVLGSALVAGWQFRRARVAEGMAAVQQGLAAARARRLGLLAREVAQPGLALLGAAERLSSHPEPASPHCQNAAQVLREEAARLLRMGDEIADELATQSGPRRLREEPLVLLELLEQALEEVRRPLGDGVRHWRAAPDLAGLTVLADRRALSRVLTQVLARAVRETRVGDCIAVRAVRGPELLSVVVEDEGAGLAPGDLGAGALGGEGTRGLALGLATARDLMRAHGGDLLVEAVAGIGTRAWLTLPRARVLSDLPPEG